MSGQPPIAAEPTVSGGLPGLHDTLWRELSRAVHDKHHAWRTPVLATVSSAGDEVAADARTVVLREVDADTRQLIVYTDTRSPKVAQIATHPAATLLFWSPQKHWQLRVRAQVTQLADAAALAQRWQRVGASPAAGDYLSAQAPGAPLPENSSMPAKAGLAPHFGVLVATASHFDWLELARSGHRRAGFDLLSGRQSWLTP